MSVIYENHKGFMNANYSCIFGKINYLQSKFTQGSVSKDVPDDKITPKLKL